MTRVHIMSMSNSMGSRRPYKLVTVSRFPEKATIMVKRLAEMLDDRYLVIHAANCEHLEEVNFRVRDLQPDMLVWSSSWTPEQVDFIRSVTKRLKADVDMCPLPEDAPTDLSVDALLLRLKSNSRTKDV